MGRVRIVVLSLALANFSECAAAVDYRVDPVTLQQVVMREGTASRQPATHFLKTVLPIPSSSHARSYRHLLPRGALPDRVLELKVGPRLLFGETVGGHPFAPAFRQILMYWGCAQDAAEGQPRVIAADGVNDGQLAQLLSSSTKPRVVLEGVRPISGPGSVVAYHGEIVPEQWDMRGTHERLGGRVRARFTVGEEGKFLPPVYITRAWISERGAATTHWARVPGATAYFVNVFVQRKPCSDVIVWWSSRIPEAGFLLTQTHPGQEELARLRGGGVLMSPDVEDCAIPGAVIQHATHAIAIQVHAFAPESVIVPRTGEGESGLATVKIAPRATTTVLLVSRVARLELKAGPRMTASAESRRNVRIGKRSAER